jgi:hypothetical protein
MATEDFGGAVLGKPIMLVGGDHQNKATLALRAMGEKPDLTERVGCAANSRPSRPHLGHEEHRPQSAGRDSGGITIAGHSRLIGSSSLLAVWSAGMDFGVWLGVAAGLAIADNAANHALLIQPNSVLALRAKAFALRAQGKWQEAEAVLHRMIDLQPTEANRHWELGQVLMAEGRHQEALESFEAAKRFAGGSDSVFIYDAYLAMAEPALGQLAEATAMARLSLSEFPPDSRQPKVARRPAPGQDARQLTLAHGAA